MELLEGLAKTLNQFKVYELLAEGQNRIIFIKNDTTVYKVPLNEEGIYDNYSDVARYKQFSLDEDIYATCLLTHYHDIPVLEMQRVYPLLSTDILPSWAIDLASQKLGRTLEGKIVVYDYSSW